MLYYDVFRAVPEAEAGERPGDRVGAWLQTALKHEVFDGNTFMIRHNVDNRLIMEQMGHTNIACTENHYHRNRQSIDTKSQIISSIAEFQAK